MKKFLPLLAMSAIIVGLLSCHEPIKPKTDYLDAYMNPLRVKTPKSFSSDQVKINSSTVLLVVDMQNGFLPAGPTSAGNGAFLVSEGNEITGSLAELIDKVAKAGGTIIVTRDYHPRDHASFDTHGGLFPPHCIMNTHSAELAADIQDALERNSARVIVAWKAHKKEIDSFGAFPYKQAYADGRITGCDSSKAPCEEKNLSFTGAVVIKDGVKVKFGTGGREDWTIQMSILDSPTEAEFITAAITDCTDTSTGKFNETLPNCQVKQLTVPAGTKTLLATGLAFDYCVMDSAVNAKTLNPDLDVKIVGDQTRAAWFPAEKKDFGKGPDHNGGRFISGIDDTAKRLEDSGVTITHTSNFAY